MSKYNLEDIEKRKALGESWNEIAVAYDTTESAVKRAYFRLKKKSDNKKAKTVTSDIPARKTPSKVVATARVKKIKYPLSIDQVNRLLQANKDHLDYPYLNAQIFGGEYKGKMYTGKLQSDIRKLLGFIQERA